MNKDTSLPSTHYQAYLLRFRHEFPADPQTGWHMTLVDLQTGRQWGFASPEQLVGFLKQNVLTKKNGTGDSRSRVLSTNQIKKRS